MTGQKRKRGLIFLLDIAHGGCYNNSRSACANIAQLVEQRFRKPQVKGSSPFIGFIEV